MQKTVFWIIFIILPLIADVALPIMWSLVAAIPAVFVSWWIAYRSGWIED